MLLITVQVRLLNLLALGRPVILNWTFNNINNSVSEHLSVDSNNTNAIVVRCTFNG